MINSSLIIKWTVPVVYASFIIPILIWGSGVSPDSCAYLATANNLYNGNGFLLYDDTYVTNWPWLYPLVLAGLKYFDVNNLLVLAGLFNLGLGIAAYLVLYNYFKQTHSKYLLVLCFLMPPFIKMFVMLWSEPLFMLLYLLGLLIWVDDTKTSNKHLVGMFLCFAAACLTRYIGMFLIVSMVAVQMFQLKSIQKKQLVALLALIPIGINFWVNSKYKIQVIESNTDWRQLSNIWFNTFNSFGSTLIQLGAFTLLFAGFIYSSNKTKPIVIALCAYWLIITAFTELSNAELLRYLLPFLPVFILVFDKKNITKNIPNKPILATLVVLTFINILYNVKVVNTGTGGYNKAGMKNEELRLYSLKNDKIIYSNAPDYIYFLSGKNAKMLKFNTVLRATDEVVIAHQAPRETQWPEQQQFVITSKHKHFTCYKLQ
jgi:hypothetical protein